MTKLEEQIFLAITEQPFYTNIDKARIAASIALELAEKSYDKGYYKGLSYDIKEVAYYHGSSASFKQFIQDYE